MTFWVFVGMRLEGKRPDVNTSTGTRNTKNIQALMKTV